MSEPIGGAAARRHSAPIVSASLWAVMGGVLVIAVHALTRHYGPALGSYRSGIITLIVMLLAATYSARKRSMWLTVRWSRWATRVWRPLGLRLVLSDRLESWRFVHIGIGVAAMLPFWWHTQAGPASTLEIVLKCSVVLLVVSGFAGACIEDFLPHATRMSADEEVRLEDVETRIHALYVEAEEAILGHSEELVHAYLKNIRPILAAPQPLFRLMAATLAGVDLAPRIGTRIRQAGVRDDERASYDALAVLAEHKIRLEANRFHLELGVRWLGVHITLVVITAMLIVFHVAGVLYFAGI
ncbi:MAG: hypothetical protein ACREQ4_13355 [Candidatus Binataceae bacterium]